MLTLTEPHILHFEGKLWRMLYDASQHTLAYELRNEVQHLTTFGAVSLGTGQLLAHHIHLPQEPWWTGLADAAHGMVILQGYRKPDMPQPLGVYAFAQDSGELCWQRQEFSLEATLPEGFLLMQEQESHKWFYVCQAQDGKLSLPIHELDLDTQRQAIVQYAEHKAQHQAFPTLLHESMPEFEALQADLQALLGVQAKGQIDLLQLEQGLSIVSYYEELAGGGLANHLAVFRNGQCVHQDLLWTGGHLYGYDPFTLMGGVLVYIRHLSELVLLNLH